MADLPVEIGTVTLNYDRSGSPLAATFEPAIHVTDTSELKSELMKLSPTSPEEVRTQAETVLASWFATLNSIELQDREVFRIASEVLSCIKWDNNQPKTCVVRFNLVTIQ